MAFWGEFALFLSLCCISLCCNRDWFPYQGSCYQTAQYLYDIQMARRYCQLAGGQLAHVNGSETLRFLNTLPLFNGESEYWIEDGSWIENSNTATARPTSQAVTGVDCPYAKILEINYEYCVEKKYFICEMKINESVRCPTGFDSIGKHCYRAITNQAAYTEASKFCGLQQAQLAVLDTEEEEWEARASIIGRNQTFLVGAKNDGNVTKWSNEKEFDPVLQLFVNDSIGDCLGLVSLLEHPTVFSWASVNCTQRLGFLCEAEPVESTTVESTTPTTTLTPLTCPYGYNWKSHEESGFCFWETTYETERLNWFQARDFCKRYGGNLASYENEGQETAGLGGARGHYKGMWIGMERDRHNVFHWTDGTTLNYTNWDWDEPKLGSKTKFCVAHSPKVKWQLDYCGVRRWFICKSPKVRIAIMPDAPPIKYDKCDVPGVSTYRTKWYRYEDHCYLVQEQSKYTWDTGRLFCQDNGGLMTSIHSFEETNFILNTMSVFPDSNLWIGLSAHGLHSSYSWTDNSPFSFTYWSDEKNESEGINSCVTLNRRDGSWNNEHCNRLQGVICKRGLNGTYDLTTTESTTIMPGNCENGWYNFGNKCYKFYASHWSQRVDWFIAKKECEKIGASLVSIHSQDEQDLLTDIVLEANTSVWIGLRATDGGTIFHWSDDSRMDYTNWDANEPEYSKDNDLYRSRETELCVQMEFGDSRTGKWDDISCSSSRGYICEKRKDPTYTGPYEDPFNCPNISGWYKLGSSCYGFFEEQQLTWLEAQGECRKFQSNLITYKSAAVSIFLKKKVKRKDVYYWIGVREKSVNKYEALTGYPMSYTNWMTGQPRAASSVMDNCVTVVVENGWLVKSCKEKHPYICKFNRDAEPEPETNKHMTCERLSGDWYDYGGQYCYMIETSMRKTWGEAMHYCFKHGGFLASFHSAEQIKEIQQHVIYDRRPPSLHIGLGKKSDGSFDWVDTSPVDFTNWDGDEPEDSDNECVEMAISTGKWNNIDCIDIYRGFICSVAKETFIDEALPTNSSLVKEEDIISEKLTVGGILVIIICILGILGIIGVTVYYLRPTKQVQPKLLDPENL